MKQWLFSLGVFFLGLVIYTLVKETWEKTKDKLNAKN
jgi:hypothetical protein